MSARGELTDVFLQRGHGPTSALVAAHELLAGHRAEVLTEAADAIDAGSPSAECDCCTGAANLLRRMATNGKASSPEPTATQQPDECTCMPHRKLACGHCLMDLCGDCNNCPCSCDCDAERGDDA